MIAPVGFPQANARANNLRQAILAERNYPVRRVEANPSYRNPVSSTQGSVHRMPALNINPGFVRIAQSPTFDDIHGTNFGTVTEASEVLDVGSRMPTPIREGVIATQAALAYGNPFFIRSRIQDEHERNRSEFLSPVSVN